MTPGPAAAPGAAPAAMPPGDLHVRIAPGVIVRESGSLLIGGSPSRLIRLDRAAVGVVSRWRTGGPIGTGRAVPALARRLLDAGILVPDPAPSATSCLAVVVPVHGRPQQLARCLAALSQTASDAGICVVDDGSPDPDATQRIAAAYGATVVRHPARRGPATARNTGYAHTSSPLVAFVDSDVVVEPGCLARLAGHFADPAVGAVAPRILGTEPPTGTVAGYEARRSSLDMGPRAGCVRPWSDVPYLPSATLVLRREAFGAGFDERLRIGEDVDLVWRLAASGWGVWYDPSVAARHEHRATVGAFARRRFIYATSIGPLAKRHRTALAALRVDTATCVVALALMRRPRAAVALSAVLVVRTRAYLEGRTTEPVRLAGRLTARSLLRSWRSVAHAVRRPWWPLCAVAGVRNRRAAQLLCGAWVSGVLEAGTLRPTAAMLTVADDLISGAGTWWSCLEFRTATPLLPARRVGSRTTRPRARVHRRAASGRRSAMSPSRSVTRSPAVRAIPYR